LEATIHLDEEEALLARHELMIEQQRQQQQEMMERLQDPRVREAVSLEALHARLAEHRRIMSGGWTATATTMSSMGEQTPHQQMQQQMVLGDSTSTAGGGGGSSVSFMPSVSQVGAPGTDVSVNFAEWQSKTGRRRRERPIKRKHTGTLAALVAEPLFLVHAEQPGDSLLGRGPNRGNRGNRAMHRSMRDVNRCVPKPRPPRALPEPIQNMKGLERLWVEDETSVHDALAKLERSGGFS
jgi:hypothetical protein